MSHSSREFERKGQSKEGPAISGSQMRSAQLTAETTPLFMCKIAVSPLGVYLELPEGCEWAEPTGGTPSGETAILHELCIRLEIKI